MWGMATFRVNVLPESYLLLLLFHEYLQTGRYGIARNLHLLREN